MISSPCPGQSDEALREWLGDRFAGLERIEGSDDRGVDLTWLLTRTTTWDRSRIESRRRAVAPHPDHPDRPLVEVMARLSDHPEVIGGRIMLADAGAWLLVEERGSVTLSAGGVGDERWLLFDRGDGGQLTRIRAGVPFPATSNVGRYLDSARERCSLLLEYGLAGDSRLVSSSMDGRHWEATLRDPITGIVRKVTGEIGIDGSIVATGLTEFDADGDPVRTMRFEGVLDLAGRAIPRRVTVDRSDGIREVYELRHADNVARRIVTTAAQLPQTGDPIKIADYRAPDSAASISNPGSPRITWNLRSDGDEYDTSQLEEGLAGDPRAKEPEGRTGRTIAIALSILLLGVVTAWFLRKKASST